MSEKHALDILDLEINLVQPFGSKDNIRTLNITAMVANFNIYEDLFDYTNSCDLVIIDSKGLVENFPIIGEEFVSITYRSYYEKKRFTHSPNYISPANTGTSNNKTDGFEKITRIFKVYKVGKSFEKAERANAFVLHCIENIRLMNEVSNEETPVTSDRLSSLRRLFNTSIPSKSSTRKIEEIFNRHFKGSESFKSLTSNEESNFKKLYGIERQGIKHNTEPVYYLPPGVPPFEAIQYLLDNTSSPDPTNNEEYILFQTYLGFHLTTMKELKDYKEREGSIKSYVVGDQAAKSNGTNIHPQDPGDSEIILKYDFVHQSDTFNNFENGLFANRVVGIDLLTKRFDSQKFNYIEDFEKLNIMRDTSKLNSQGIISSQSDFADKDEVSSTNTRYFVTELTTSNLDTRDDAKFSPREYGTREVSNYLDTPYIKYCLVKKGYNNFKDHFTNYPSKKHIKLTNKVANRATLDNFKLRVVVPGNSNLKIGDLVRLYIPRKGFEDDTLKYSERYNKLFGDQSSHGGPLFLITNVRQTYDASTLTYLTTFDAVSDSFDFLALDRQTTPVAGLPINPLPRPNFLDR
jgi:hypothetical protein